LYCEFVNKNNNIYENNKNKKSLPGQRLASARQTHYRVRDGSAKVRISLCIVQYFLFFHFKIFAHEEN